MKAVPLLFRITSIVVFLQLLLGGLLTFDFITPVFHIITGLAVLVLAIATMTAVLVSKPALRQLRGLSIGLVVLIVVQGILGFATLDSGSQVVAWVHFVVALGIYGMTVAGTIMATMVSRVPLEARSPETKSIPGVEHKAHQCSSYHDWRDFFHFSCRKGTVSYFRYRDGLAGHALSAYIDPVERFTQHSN